MARKRRGSVALARRSTRSSRSSSLQDDNESEPPLESETSPKETEIEEKLDDSSNDKLPYNETDSDSKNDDCLSEHYDISDSTNTTHNEEKASSSLITLDVQQIVLGDCTGEVRVGKGDEIIVGHGEEVMWDGDVEEVVYESMDIDEQDSPSSEVEDDSDHFIEDNDGDGDQLIIMNEDGEVYGDKDNRYVIVVSNEYECSNDIQGIDLSELPEGSCEIITVVRESDNENSQESTEIQCDNINDVIGTSDGVIHNISISQYHSDDENMATANFEGKEKSDEKPVMVHYFSEISKESNLEMTSDRTHSETADSELDKKCNSSEKNFKTVRVGSEAEELNSTIKDLKLENNDNITYESEKTSDNIVDAGIQFINVRKTIGNFQEHFDIKQDKILVPVFQNQNDYNSSKFVKESSTISGKGIESAEIKIEDLIEEKNSFNNSLSSTNVISCSVITNDSEHFNSLCKVTEVGDQNVEDNDENKEILKEHLNCEVKVERLQDCTISKFDNSNLNCETEIRNICLGDEIILNPNVHHMVKNKDINESLKERELIKDARHKISDECKLVLDENVLNYDESEDKDVTNLEKNLQLEENCKSNQNQKETIAEEMSMDGSQQDMDISLESSDEGNKVNNDEDITNDKSRVIKDLSNEESHIDTDLRTKGSQLNKDFRSECSHLYKELYREGSCIDKYSSSEGIKTSQNKDCNTSKETKTLKNEGSDIPKTEDILQESSNIKDNDEDKQSVFRSRSGSTDTTGSDSGSNSGSGRRRSSRLKSIGMTKPTADSDGGGKWNSLSGPQPIPATPPVPGYELDKPVKVKSRWRRSSELEMGGVTKRSYDIDINNSSHSRFTDSDNTVTPPRPFQPTTPPSPAPSDKGYSEDKEVEERLRNFQQITSNMYLTERYVSID